MAADLKPLTERNIHAHATVSWDDGDSFSRGSVRAAVGREPLVAAAESTIIARFSDGRPAALYRRVGDGRVFVVGFWAGLTYSARVRRPDFDMRSDFDPALRSFIAAPATSQNVYQPILPADPLVEGILLEKDGRQAIALMNWSYRRGDDHSERRPRELQPVTRLKVVLPAAMHAKQVRSFVHGELRIERRDSHTVVIVPKLDEIDLLILE